MKFENLKSLATRSILFSLEKTIAPKIIDLLYILGIAAIVLKAISHLFVTFSFSFGAGLWGLIEIATFGLLAFVILRIICEILIMFFKKDETKIKPLKGKKLTKTLNKDVSDAISELARDEAQKQPAPEQTAPSASAATKKPSAATKKPSAATKKPTRRTAKRSPHKKAEK